MISHHKESMNLKLALRPGIRKISRYTPSIRQLSTSIADTPQSLERSTWSENKCITALTARPTSPRKIFPNALHITTCLMMARGNFSILENGKVAVYFDVAKGELGRQSRLC